jgi:endo-1,4-beta-xylanase
MLSRRQTFTGGASLIAALAASASGPNFAEAAPADLTVARCLNRRIPYGVCVRRQPLEQDAAYRGALKTYCQQLTPEGGFIWLDLRPTRNQFNFDFVDEVLAFADANAMAMRGNTLVWHDAMPDWTRDISSAAEAERELTTHIERVVSRYRSRIKIWHAVNEPIDDDRGKVGGLRPSIWLQYLGPKYIDMAFRLAHQIDPSAELLLNENDIECVGASFAARRQALQALVRDLLARGVPLHGIGLQGHLRGKYQIDRDGVYQFASEIRSLGLSVHITELDVLDDDLPGSPPVRDAIVAARAYDFLESIFAAAHPAAVVTWGITDRYTWVPMWHKRKDGLINRPLPLDENYRPKPLRSVIDYFCGATA